MKESDYPATRPGDCYYDTANPAFFIKDHRDHGKALKADYKIRPEENTKEYWFRVYTEITRIN